MTEGATIYLKDIARDLRELLLHVREIASAVKDGKYDPSSPVLTLGTVIGSALFAPKQAAQGPRGASDSDPVASAKRAALGLRLIACDKIDLTSEQVMEIKGSLGAFPPLTVLRPKKNPEAAFHRFGASFSRINGYNAS